jgi:hypothetical protein
MGRGPEGDGVTGDFRAEAADSFCLRPGEAASLLDGHPRRRFAVLGDSVVEGGEPLADGPLSRRDRLHGDGGSQATSAAETVRRLGTRLASARTRS